MIKQITRKWSVDKKKSFMIGDSLSDKKCAKKATYISNMQKEIFIFR